jgi:hypothetical protein
VNPAKKHCSEVQEPLQGEEFKQKCSTIVTSLNESYKARRQRTLQQSDEKIPSSQKGNPVIPPEKPKKSHQNKKSQVFSKKARKSNFFDNPLFPIIIKKS